MSRGPKQAAPLPTAADIERLEAQVSALDQELRAAVAAGRPSQRIRNAMIAARLEVSDARLRIVDAEMEKLGLRDTAVEGRARGLAGEFRARLRKRVSELLAAHKS